MKQYYGYWWLAAAPDERATGVLVADADGELTLTLYGRLGTEQSGWLEGQWRILGEVDMGAIISLNRCFVRQAPGDFGLPRQVWHAHEAVIGAKFDAVEPWAFCGALFDMPLLTRWTARNSIEEILDLNDQGRARQLGIAVQPQRWALWEREGIKVELAHSASVRLLEETVTALEAPIRLCVFSPKPLTSDQFRDIAIRPLQVLIGLASGKFTAALSADVLLFPREPDNRERYLPWRWQPLTRRPDREVQFSFHHSDVLALGADRLEAWIGLHTVLDSVFDLYLGILRESGLAELSFLMVVQALETYHRRISTDTVLPVKTWEPLRDDIAALISATVSGSVQMALLRKLDYYNEVSLRHRLKALLAPLETVATQICGRKEADFINAIVNTRNYYTHWDAASEAGALRGHALAYAISRLTALLEILLLRDIGFESTSRAWQDVLKRRVSWVPKSS